MTVRGLQMAIVGCAALGVADLVLIAGWLAPAAYPGLQGEPRSSASVTSRGAPSQAETSPAPVRRTVKPNPRPAPDPTPPAGRAPKAPVKVASATKAAPGAAGGAPAGGTPDKPTPAPKEPTPAPKEPTPAPKEPTPAPKEPAPAPKEPTPAPKEPTPAPKEPTPAPKGPKEPTPAPPPTAPAPSTRYVTLGQIYFKTASYSLNERAQRQLRALLEKLKKLPRRSVVELRGHADSRGQAAFNRRLSRLRAINVRFFLRQFPATRHLRLRLRHLGSRKASKDQDPSRWARDRRVHVVHERGPN